MNKNYSLFLIIFLCSITFCFGQELISFSSLNNSGCSGIISNDPDVSGTGICRSSGVIATTGTNYSTEGWPTGAISTTDYLEWTITPTAGNLLQLSNMLIRYQRESGTTGPEELEIRADYGSGFVTLHQDTNISFVGPEQHAINLNTIPVTGNTITFRLYAYNSDGPNGDFYIHPSASGNRGIIIFGNVISSCSISEATWNGSSWIWNDGTAAGTPPDLTTQVILNSNYDTSGPGLQASFQACSLTINSGFSLTVSDTDYVEVETNVSVENAASIIVQTQGAFIQRGIGVAAGTFTLNGTATSQVNKLTAPLANWYDYTYWSSPVASADVDIALSFANPNRRFWYDASNYLDSDNDDIDDDANDWTLATGSGIMIIGRGYASTHNDIGFTAGLQYQYNFEGALNTGDYTYPLSYDATNLNHWNLVGNPYPSAISVRGTGGLFDANIGIIDTAIYLWSHDSPPLDTNPGNEEMNFNANDYAIINSTMSIAGASGIIPGNYIPSGQSFFVSSLANSSINFNNAMRISGDNSNDLFFRNSNASENPTDHTDESRLWLNLMSNDGVFSQIGVGYVNNATDGFDGLGYDAKRNLSSNNVAIIYSQIEGENRKLAIQGKAVQSLNFDEIIKIGFTTTIQENKIYTFSLDNFEGEFFSNNAVYVKDNYLNILHDLKDSDYNFASEEGEFNDRFEIVFRADALSVDDNSIDSNDLTIIELTNGDVRFDIGNNLTIKRIEILDILGRRIYEIGRASCRERVYAPV